MKTSWKRVTKIKSYVAISERGDCYYSILIGCIPPGQILCNNADYIRMSLAREKSCPPKGTDPYFLHQDATDLEDEKQTRIANTLRLALISIILSPGLCRTYRRKPSEWIHIGQFSSRNIFQTPILRPQCTILFSPVK